MARRDTFRAASEVSISSTTGSAKTPQQRVTGFMTTDPSPPSDTFRTAIIGAGLAGASRPSSPGRRSIGDSLRKISRDRRAHEHSTLGCWHFDRVASAPRLHPLSPKSMHGWLKESWLAGSPAPRPGSRNQAFKQVGRKRVCGATGMSALGRQLAKGLSVRRQQRVLSPNQPRTWFLDLESGEKGPFHHVVIATPQDKRFPSGRNGFPPRSSASSAPKPALLDPHVWLE